MRTSGSGALVRHLKRQISICPPKGREVQASRRGLKRSRSLPSRVSRAVQAPLALLDSLRARQVGPWCSSRSAESPTPAINAAQDTREFPRKWLAVLVAMAASRMLTKSTSWRAFHHDAWAHGASQYPGRYGRILSLALFNYTVWT